MNNIMKHYFALLLTVLTILASCSYDEHIDTYNIKVRLSESVADVSVKMTNNIGSTFEASTDGDGSPLHSARWHIQRQRIESERRRILPSCMQRSFV